MKILTWNIRGMGQSCKCSRLADIIKDNDIDLVGIQETKKEDFVSDVILSIDAEKKFMWEWVRVQQEEFLVESRGRNLLAS